MNLFRRTLIALLLTLLAQPAKAQSQTGVLGTNLNGLSDFNRQWAFVDAFKLSRPWLDASFNEFPAAQIDADGWVTTLGGAAPTNVAQALMFFDNSGHYPATPNCVATPTAANCYVLKFDGAGTITFGAGASIVSTPGPGNRFFVNVPQQTPGNGGIILRLTATTPGNPVKNIRFIMAGFEGTADAQPFHPTFLQTLAPYKLIRFMDWMGTNGSTIQNFSQWKTLASATQTVVEGPGFGEHGSGVAFEYMVDLCNTLDADMWINLPAQATDGFLTSAATLIRDRLEPGRKLYIEYSNEIWNGQFLQGIFIQQQGESLGLGSGFTAKLNYQARRSKEIFAIFETVFGGTSRLVRTLAGQAANADLVKQVAEFENSFLKADAIALAPYMDGGGRVGSLANLTSLNASQVVAQMQTDLIGTSNTNDHVKLWMDTHRNLVHGPGLFGSFPDGMVNDQGVPLRIVAYEGGQHLLALGPNNGNATANTLLDNVNRDASMGTLYKQYFCQWRATTGSDSFVHFNDIFSYGQFGRWGALEFQDQVTSTSPKFLALEDYSIGGIDCAGLGFPNPPLISVNDPSVAEGNAGTTNLTFTVSLSAPAPGAITVKAKTVAGSASAGSDFTTLTQTVSFALGESSKPFTVVLNGDLTLEGDETVFVNLSNPVGAPISDPHGVGTILNDEAVPAPTVVTNAATAITQTGATINGTINPNGSATNRRFQSGLTVAYTNTSADLAIGSGNVGVAVSLGVTGLQCNTTYHYRAVGQNLGGTTNGGDLTFTTTACPPVGSNNIGAPTAKIIALNSTSKDSMSNVRAEIWYRVRLFASRSYQISAWPVDHEQGVDAPTLSLSLFSDNAGTVAATPAPVVSSASLEGSPNNHGDALPSSLLFQPTVSGTYKIRILRTSGGTVTHSVNLGIRETTLFSPWTSRAAGFEGFIEMHNNTNAPINVTLRGFDSVGVQQGASLTLTLQPNATDFRTGNQVGLPNIFAGIVLTHDGALGAVSANITTLNGANGLSFDSPFTTRSDGLLGKPVR